MTAAPEKSTGFVSGPWDFSKGNFKKYRDTKRHARMMRPHVGNFLGDRISVRPDRSSVKSAETRLPSSQE